MFEASMITGVIVALGQLAKNYIDPKYVPAISLVLGILGGVFLVPADNLQTGILNGLISGLSACGLYDVTKTLHN
ncbi:hypothetical protein [Heliophilum fasciatum]|uniref:Holin n=1 Tax=Heliophilum fasciatum TaxID=35700 RepID=A0A4R2RFU7_9FIRM|nr:hypothetical protein [Heliophilum fasciatum]MCW2278751.1 hypothetical protein [Heliophilum fasciatum]TCP62510.1 hypothetical protein EDD73_1218 [Heliophilum fasciatum]